MFTRHRIKRKTRGNFSDTFCPFSNHHKLHNSNNKQHPNTLLPKKATRKTPLSPEQKKENKLISGIRITVEHAIAGIKRLGCMNQSLRNRRPFIDDTFILLSAGLWNFHLRRD
ncbi:transposase family protein [Candidatus Regiella insecticola]|uniref:DDE Tnp4 domain-containing protein n=1 Tax=Candidatus Regiella insecticola TaxID=138073 RepID=A0A6L2ZRM9_9ENTR|nr:transposase family protein [Candidatus Regiella insecticola]GFN47065.1 uncharacterized protein RINTU1_29230 [Candidatus Regiella insecticola]